MKYPHVVVSTDASVDVTGVGLQAWAAIYRVGTQRKGIYGTEYWNAPPARASASRESDRIELLAIVRALQELSMPCIVTVYTDSLNVLRLIANGRLEEWERYGWTDVPHMYRRDLELWKELWTELGRHRAVSFHKAVSRDSLGRWPDHDAAHALARAAREGRVENGRLAGEAASA